MYGYTAEFRKVNVEAISEGNPPYSEDKAVKWIQRALSGKPQRFDWKCKDKAGRIFWAGVNLKRTVLNSQPRLLAIVRDITERKEAEEAIRASRERFRTMADYTYDWEYWRGPNGRFRYVSPIMPCVNAGEKAWRRSVEKRGARDGRRLYCNSRV